MPKAGWCADCETNVWLTEEGGCVNGHAPDRVSSVYETKEGSDTFADAGEAIENAAREAGAAMRDAWKQAEPDAREAAAAAAEAARKAAEAAGAFGKKFFGREEAPASGDQEVTPEEGAEGEEAASDESAPAEG